MTRERQLVLTVMAAICGVSCIASKDPPPAAQSLLDSTGTVPAEDGQAEDADTSKPPLDVFSDSTFHDGGVGDDLTDWPGDVVSIADSAWLSDAVGKIDTIGRDDVVDIAIDIITGDISLSNDAEADPKAEVATMDAETPGDAASDIDGRQVQDVDVAPLPPGSPCDDHSLCTGDDVVLEDGECAGTKLPCVDSDPCTQDHCYDRVGCTHVSIPGCSSECGECPYSLGFECDSTGENPICVNESTDEVYIPSGVFWFGTNPKAGGTFEQWSGEYGTGYDYSWDEIKGVLSFDSLRFPSYQAGFAIDRRQFNGYSYMKYCNENGFWHDSGYPCIWLGVPAALCENSELLPSGSYDETGIGGSSFCIAQGKRLCWETEWEKAGAGGCAQLGVPESELEACAAATRVYPWGDSPQVCEVNPLDPCHSSFPERGELKETQSVYGTLDQGGLPEAALGVMPKSGSIAQLIAIGVIISPEDMIKYRVGADGILPPVSDIDSKSPAYEFAGFCSSGSVRIVQRTSLLHWRVEGAYSPPPPVRKGSARCCRDIPLEAVTPEGGEPPWPPELARPEPCYGPWMFPVPPL